MNSRTIALTGASYGPEARLGRSRQLRLEAMSSIRLSATAAFYLQASIVLFFLAGSSAPTPLYAVYQAAWAFTPITIAIVFGVYALAVLGALLTLGTLSDHIGRRPLLLAATLLQAAAMLVFMHAGSVSALLLARVVQGISTGAAMGTLGAGMLDLDREKGTLANAIAPMTGTALGGIGSGLLVQFLPAPTQLIYEVLCAIFVVQALGVVFMHESTQRKPGALASLRPQFRLPPAVREALFVATPVLIATWALAGFYGSLGPTLVRRLVGGSSPALGGLALFVLAGSGALNVLYMHARQPRTLMISGTSALALGVAITLVAIDRMSVSTFFLGTAIAGMGFGAGFQGAIRTVIPLATPQERAGVLSIVYLIAYLAMGLPAVLAGVGVVYGAGLLPTASQYGAVVIALAGFARIAMLVRRPLSAASR
jgi:MFS family permease